MSLENIDINGSKEPEIVQAVVNEIKSMGDNTKKQYEELRKSYAEMKSMLDDDTVYEEKFTKFSEDVTIRQEALDKKAAEMESKMTERVDAIEVAMKRSPGQLANADMVDKEARDAMEFYKSKMSIIDGGASIAKMNKFNLDNSNMKAYQEYCRVFETFLRRAGDERSLMPEELQALHVGSDADGGFAVKPAMSNRIIKRVFESDPIRQLAAVETISTDALEWMIDWSEVDTEWESETVATNEDSTPKMDKKRISVHPLASRPVATQQLLEDAAINIENWLSDKVGSKMARKEAAAFVTGNGVGKPRGFLTYPTGVNGDIGKIEQINMGAAAALTTDGFIDVKYSLVEEYLSRGTWLMNRLTVAETMKLKDGDGNYIWKPGITEDRMSTILGLPVRMSTSMPTVVANSLSVALAFWKEAYMIVDRLGITVQRDPYTKKPFVEFYFRKRVGGDIVNYQAIKLGKVSA